LNGAHFLHDFLKARHRVSVRHNLVELGAHFGPVGFDPGDPGKLLAVVDRPVAMDGECRDG
jgi:hypothetical protein